MKVQHAADWYSSEALDLADQAEDLTFNIRVCLACHRTMKIQPNSIDRTGVSADCVQEFIPEDVEGRSGYGSARSCSHMYGG